MGKTNEQNRTVTEQIGIEVELLFQQVDLAPPDLADHTQTAMAWKQNWKPPNLKEW
jgi:hypothetical protein